MSTGQVAATGVIMLAAMPVLIGLQLLLAFLSHDIASVPRIALSNVPSVEMPMSVADGRHP